MLRSELFCPATRAQRRDGTDTTRLLVQAGYVRDFGNGLWGLTPIGERVRSKLVARIDAAFRAADGQRVRLPSLQERERWAESGRWDAFEGEMFTLTDRDGRDLCLAPSHEEAAVHLVDGRVQSYDDLPVHVYQIGAKFRDDRARDGLVRAREFGMADGYSVHADTESLAATYRAVRAAFVDCCADLGLEFAVVPADTGVMGGHTSEELLAPVTGGSDRLRWCETDGCRFGRRPEETSRTTCPDCGGSLTDGDATEVAHLFQLGRRYTDPAGLAVDDAAGDGGETTLEMGSYGIGVGRLLQTLVRQQSDGDTVQFPVTDWGCVAPFRAAIVPIGGGEAARVATELHETIGRDVLCYDGDRSVGERFAESALVGVPATVIVGDTYRETGRVEIERRDGETTRHEPDTVAGVLRELAAGDRPASSGD